MKSLFIIREIIVLASAREICSLLSLSANIKMARIKPSKWNWPNLSWRCDDIAPRRSSSEWNISESRYNGRSSTWKCFIRMLLLSSDPAVYNCPVNTWKWRKKIQSLKIYLWSCFLFKKEGYQITIVASLDVSCGFQYHWTVGDLIHPLPKIISCLLWEDAKLFNQWTGGITDNSQWWIINWKGILLPYQ